MKTFEKQIESLSEVAASKMCEAEGAVSEVTKLLQTKYPELEAVYLASDGGIIFIDDSDMTEYYSLTGVYQRFGRR